MTACSPLLLLTLGLAVLVAIAAHVVARFVARPGAGQNIWVIIGTIVVTLAVLQGGARLAVLARGIYETRGIDPTAVCGTTLQSAAFVATILIIAAYVASFFATWHLARRRA